MPTEFDATDLPVAVISVSIDEQKIFDGLRFPFILSPAGAFRGNDVQFWNEWVKQNFNVIQELLLKYGAILFRGFSIDSAEEFDEFAKAFGYDPFQDGLGVAARKAVVGNVYRSTETDPGALIPFHHEMAHLRDNPQILFFYCEIPAKEGGETPLALSNVIYRKMAERDLDFVNRLQREGLRYVRVAPNGDEPSTLYGRGWQSTFFTSDREEAERKATASGYDFEWLNDGSMRTTTETLRAIRVDKRTGKTMWFNSVFTYLKVLDTSPVARSNVAVIFPNGENVNAKMLETLNQVMDEVRVSFKWHRTDVVMIDNRTVQHSRSDFFVPPRRILTSLFNDEHGPI